MRKEMRHVIDTVLYILLGFLVPGALLVLGCITMINLLAPVVGLGRTILFITATILVWTAIVFSIPLSHEE